MLLISYDITSNKTRTRFSKFLKQYGNSVQYSIYKIKNSKRIINIITNEIENKYKKTFNNTDSIMIFNTCCACDQKVIRYGCALHDEENIVYLE